MPKHWISFREYLDLCRKIKSQDPTYGGYIHFIYQRIREPHAALHDWIPPIKERSLVDMMAFIMAISELQRALMEEIPEGNFTSDDSRPGIWAQ